MAKFYMTIGISGSGKTEWIKDRTEHVVSPDYLRTTFGDISDQSNNAKVWAIATKMTVELLKSGTDVILDATNVKRSDRARFLSALPECFTVAVVFLSDIDLSHERIQKDLREGKVRSNVPYEVLVRQNEAFVAGFDTIREEFDEVIEVY